MKELFETIYGKKVKMFGFKQNINVYNKQYTDGEIYDTEVEADEPTYIIFFEDESKITVELSEVLVMLFNLKK